MGLIETLRKIEKSELMPMLFNPQMWNTLDVNYFPPRVERLWLQYDEGHRLFIHIIHPTEAECLFHKHRWEAAFKLLKGSYEMGLTMSEQEITSGDAYRLPNIAKFILTAGTYYEMSYTHTAHYVKPLSRYSVSLMLTGNMYPDKREEAKHDGLQPLTIERKQEILDEVKDIILRTDYHGSM